MTLIDFTFIYFIFEAKRTQTSLTTVTWYSDKLEFITDSNVCSFYRDSLI